MEGSLYTFNFKLFYLMSDKFLKSFTVKLLAFFIVIFLSDFFIGHLLQTFYFKQKAGFDYQATYAINEVKAEFLIFGSSRAANLFDPEIFESRLNMSCFNAGRDGYPIFYHYALLQANLMRHVPKKIILSFDAGNFSIDQEDYDRISALLPYYKNHTEFKSIIRLKGPYENLKMLSSIYPYNSLLIPIILGYANSSKEAYANIKGYFPYKKIINGPLINFDYTKEKKLDTIKINIFKLFIQHCVDLNIDLYIVCTPYLINSKGTDLSIITAKKISQQYNISFLDYSRDTFYTNRSYLFADFRHLNEKGVKLFSNIIVDTIKILNH